MQLFEVYGCTVRPLLKAVEDRDDCCSGDSGGDEGRDEAGGEGGEGRHTREQAEVPGEVQAQYTTQVQHLGTYTASQFLSHINTSWSWPMYRSTHIFSGIPKRCREVGCCVIDSLGKHVGGVIRAVTDVYIHSKCCNEM